MELLIERFFAKYEARLTVGEARGLNALMELADNDLLDLVMGRAQAADEQLRGVVHKLRSQ